MENNRRLIGVLKQQLTEDVQHDCQGKKSGETSSDYDAHSALRDLLGELICDALEESHVGRMRRCCRGEGGQEVSLLRKIWN